ncbi:MAG: hypothetical protein ABIX28_00615 [Vicinamibacterales bacterium]
MLLAIVHTWPLATAPGTWSRNDNGDAQLNEWIMAWVAHQLPRAPTRLFAANIFYPAHDTLAFSEPLIVPAVMGAPLAWLGGSPVLVFNLVLILGFALTAWAGTRLVEAWTGDRLAGLLAGSMFAFNTHTLTRLAHIQGIHAWGLPLALLAADRIVTRTWWRDAVWLALWMTAMACTSGYLVVFASLMVAVVVAVRVRDWIGKPVRVLGTFALAAGLAGIGSLPVYLPYARVARDQGMVRSLETVADFSASPKGYLAAAGRIHISTWSGRFFKDPVDSFFPGFIVIALAALALWQVVRRAGADDEGGLTRRRVVMLIAIAITGFVLSLGVRTPVYGWVFHVFPPMQGLRAAARFGNLFLLGMAVLAAVGLAGLRRQLPPRRALIAGVVLVAVANLESLRAPFQYTRFEGIPAIYSLLADEPGRVVLAEAPFYPPQAVFENAPYVLASTVHWRPLMNGYSGYTPASYRAAAASFWFFPEDYAIQAMRKAGVTHVMVHPSRFYQDATSVMTKVNASPFLVRLAIGRRGEVLYRLR